MKILIYLLSLILGGFIYFLFASYVAVSSGLSSAGPLVCVGCAILVFGFLSWFHMYKPRTGAILLTLATLGMYFFWPIHLLIEYVGESAFKPAITEFFTPAILGVLVIGLVWKSQDSKLNKWVKLVLAIPPSMIGLFVLGYSAVKLIG
ncbi:MAG: hypothetical protein AAGI38_11975 [Bacteroidota bacterium]